MQTELLGGAKILLKRVQQRYNDRRQTDRRTDRQTTDGRFMP